MRVTHDSDHYALGRKAWSHQLPPGGPTVYVKTPDSPEPKPHTVALFHQLYCLDKIQEAYVNEGSHRTSEIAQHCMNYLRQTIMCMGDMRGQIQANLVTANGYDTTCYDWEVIFKEATKNQEAYAKYKS
jgi:hypothetical protein